MGCVCISIASIVPLTDEINQHERKLSELMRPSVQKLTSLGRSLRLPSRDAVSKMIDMSLSAILSSHSHSHSSAGSASSFTPSSLSLCMQDREWWPSALSVIIAGYHQEWSLAVVGVGPRRTHKDAIFHGVTGSPSHFYTDVCAFELECSVYNGGVEGRMDDGTAAETMGNVTWRTDCQWPMWSGCPASSTTEITDMDAVIQSILPVVAVDEEEKKEHQYKVDPLTMSVSVSSSKSASKYSATKTSVGATAVTSSSSSYASQLQIFYDRDRLNTRLFWMSLIEASRRSYTPQPLSPSLSLSPSGKSSLSRSSSPMFHDRSLTQSPRPLSVLPSLLFLPGLRSRIVHMQDREDRLKWVCIGVLLPNEYMSAVYKWLDSSSSVAEGGDARQVGTMAQLLPPHRHTTHISTSYVGSHDTLFAVSGYSLVAETTPYYSNEIWIYHVPDRLVYSDSDGTHGSSLDCPPTSPSSAKSGGNNLVTADDMWFTSKAPSSPSSRNIRGRYHQRSFQLPASGWQRSRISLPMRPWKDCNVAVIGDWLFVEITDEGGEPHLFVHSCRELRSGTRASWFCVPVPSLSDRVRAMHKQCAKSRPARKTAFDNDTTMAEAAITAPNCEWYLFPIYA